MSRVFQAAYRKNHFSECLVQNCTVKSWIFEKKSKSLIWSRCNSSYTCCVHMTLRPAPRPTTTASHVISWIIWKSYERKKKRSKKSLQQQQAMMMSRHQRKWAHTFAWPKNNNYTLGLLKPITSIRLSRAFISRWRSNRAMTIQNETCKHWLVSLDLDFLKDKFLK